MLSITTGLLQYSILEQPPHSSSNDITLYVGMQNVTGTFKCARMLIRMRLLIGRCYFTLDDVTTYTTVQPNKDLQRWE